MQRIAISIVLLFVLATSADVFAGDKCHGEFNSKVHFFTNRVGDVATKIRKLGGKLVDKCACNAVVVDHAVYILYSITTVALDADSWLRIRCKMDCKRDYEEKSDPLGEMYVGLTGRCAVADEALGKCIDSFKHLGELEIVKDLVGIRHEFNDIDLIILKEFGG